MTQAAALNPLASAHWHRLADARPSLAGHVRVVRQWVRGQRWHVLQDSRNGRSCRLNAAAYEVAARLDGRLSLQALWTQLEARADSLPGQPEPPTQDEVLDIVRQLHGQRMLSFDQPPDFGALNLPGAPAAQAAATPEEPASPDAATALQAPRNHILAWRLPLLDPQAWLMRAEPLARAVFSRTGLLLWSLLMMGLLGGLLLHAASLQAHAHAWLATPRYLLLASLCYPAMKAIHEAAHALAVKRWGGEVREAGITLMMLMPVPYVDASAAHGFVHAWQRAMVSAAGIMAELSLAAIGLWCWRWTDAGLAHDIGFVLWFVGGVSTVLFNANPLQRLDGYHLLVDAGQLPNLAPRSKQWWQEAMAAWLQGPGAPEGHAGARKLLPAQGEHIWLMAYAPLAWLYQVVLWSGITLWLGSLHSWLGWALGAFTVWQSLCLPMWRWMKMAWRALLWSPPAGAGPRQAAPRWRALSLLCLPALLCLPWPDRTLVQGVVWAPDEALVRPQADGFVEAVHRPDGARVQAGDLLVTLRNPRLVAQRQRVGAQLEQAEQGAFANIGRDLGKAGQAGEQITRWQAELAHIDAQLAALQIRARHAGRLVLPQAADLNGRYLHRGDLLGHVLDGTPPLVRVVVPEDELSTLRAQTQAVSVLHRTAGMRQASPASLLRDTIAATRQLPSAALSSDMGGDTQTEAQDEHHLRTLRPVVTMDVRMLRPSPTGLDTERLGERAWVRFDRGWSPLPWQAWRWAQGRALSDFNAQR